MYHYNRNELIIQVGHKKVKMNKLLIFNYNNWSEDVKILSGNVEQTLTIFLTDYILRYNSFIRKHHYQHRQLSLLSRSINVVRF